MKIFSTNIWIFKIINYLPNLEEITPIRDPPMIPPTQKAETSIAMMILSSPSVLVPLHATTPSVTVTKYIYINKSTYYFSVKLKILTSVIIRSCFGSATGTVDPIFDQFLWGIHYSSVVTMLPSWSKGSGGNGKGQPEIQPLKTTTYVIKKQVIWRKKLI